jgi:hypothetical protein
MTNNEQQNARTNHFFDIDMHYKAGRNNCETGSIRRKYSMMICGRFNFIAPVLIKAIYNINHRLALLHLNKLVDEGLLSLCKMPNAIDGRVYVMTHKGACYASDLLEISLSFRSQSQPSRQINHPTLYHDMMNAYVLLRGVNNYNKGGDYKPLWVGFVSEREFSRLHTSKETRNVDGLVRETNKQQTVAAIEIEASLKLKHARKTILLKYLQGLNSEVYDKIFMVSQRESIFDDIKRFHNELFLELTQTTNKKKTQLLLTADDVELLRRSIIYRTKFCNELQNTFYP